MTDPIGGLNPGDYMTLFMQELRYQDPLKPLDNREFMAQMAQFSALSQLQTSNDHLSQLLSMSAANQSLLLLGKLVKLKDSTELGQVKALVFTADEPPKITILLKGGTVSKELSDIVEVHTGGT